MHTSAYRHKHTSTHTLALIPPPIRQCAVKSLTPAVVVSWFKGSVITNGDELAFECRQHRIEGEREGGVGMAPGGGGGT